jgi:hypothetical protein
MSWEAQAQAELGREWPAVQACDAVNAPMIRHWCEAMGLSLDWSGAGPAPQAMLQCWLFPGPSKARPPGSPHQDATAVQAIFAEGGYTEAVTVQADIEFDRVLVPGDRLRYRSCLESMGPDKRTGLGLGRFLGFRFEVLDEQGERVGTLRFTNLVYRPTASEGEA